MIEAAPGGALAGQNAAQARRDCKEAPVDRRIVWAVLTLATLAAALLRLPFLNHGSFWFDEIFTRDVIGAGSPTGLWQHVKATESTPPLYYLIAWILGGRSEAAMRAVPAVALTLAVPVSYLAFRRLVGQRAALATAAMLAVSPILVTFSTDARAYGLFVLTAIASIWGFSAVLERPSHRRYALWAAASIACLWTHYFGVFIVGAEALVLLWLRPGERAPTLVACAAIAVGVTPLLFLVAHQTGDERSRYIAGIPLSRRLEQTVRQFAMGANVPRTWLEASGLAIACAGLGAGGLLATRDGRRPRAVLALALIAFLVPLALAVTRIEDRFYSRNVVAVVPLLAALAAPALLRLRGIPLVAYLALAALASAWVATNWRYEQPDWRGALARARAIDRSAAVVAVTRLSGFVVRTYWGRSQTHTPVQASAAWLIVEPVRAAGHRDLRPAPVPPKVVHALKGFGPTEALILHGFKLVLLAAPRALPIVPASVLHAADVFPAPAG